MPSPGIAAVDRASTILAAFEGEPTPLTLAEFARRTGLYKGALFSADGVASGFRLPRPAVRWPLPSQQGEFQDHVFPVAEGGWPAEPITWGPGRADGSDSDTFRRSKVTLKRCDHHNGSENKSKWLEARFASQSWLTRAAMGKTRWNVR